MMHFLHEIHADMDTGSCIIHASDGREGGLKAVPLKVIKTPILLSEGLPTGAFLLRSGGDGSCQFGQELLQIRLWEMELNIADSDGSYAFFG